MEEQERYLDLLAIFYYVVAGMAALFACFPLIHLTVGAVLLVSSLSGAESSPHPEAFVGIFFMVFASVAILLGWAFAIALVVAGRRLKRREHHTYCIVVAAIACFFMPFGTVLGVLTIVLLVQPGVRELFDP